ncbi:MAG: hypothetical protein COW65_04720 [Cytophagales bacterium CG18_big_fil_WC_8_21_14_2_50_42_9]|nr:MAG: hypothetical protein COW65_04720 [Cytophagales bacterium CG18_big_fil_WC_8_21_14_2_50_42_9]
MKKYLAMIAFGLMITGTSQAQNASPRNNSSNNRYSQEQSERKDKDNYQPGDSGLNQNSPEQQANQRTEMLSHQLGLSSKQKKQVQALNLKYARQMESAEKQYSKNKDYDKKQQQAVSRIQASWNKEFKSILTHKQYAKYASDIKEKQPSYGGQSDKTDNNNNRSSKSGKL